MDYTSYAQSHGNVPFLDGSITVVSTNVVDHKLWDNSGWKRPEPKDINSTLGTLSLPSPVEILGGVVKFDSSVTWLGDPPPNQNYNIWVDPFQWPFQPHIPYEPYPIYPVQPVQPVYVPTTITTTTSVWPPSAWKALTVNDVLTASLDIPGIRAIDASVEIASGVIRFAGKRYDTGYIRNETYAIGNDYDPETAKATVDAGVLTVTVEKFKSRRAHKVTIEAK